MRHTCYVNPLLGVNPPGNCLPGPYLPMGLVRVGPDTSFPQPSNGYRSGMPIRHFSHTHVSGTGGNARYGNLGIMPFSDAPRLNSSPPYIQVPALHTRWNMPTEETAEVGYYSTVLSPSGIRVELTCSRYAGVHRYTWPAGQAGWILIDIASVIITESGPEGYLRDAESWDSRARNIGGSVEILSETEIMGRTEFAGGWGHASPYTVYFYVRSSVPFSRILASHESGTHPAGIKTTIHGRGLRLAACVDRAAVARLDVGISLLSIANARESVRAETAGLSFESVRDNAAAEWESVLSRVDLEGGTEERRRIFYSLFHRLLCMPTDLGVDSENPYWKSGVRGFTDFYCLWDSVRNANSLITLLFPGLARDIIRALLDIADHTGWLPDAHIAAHHAYMQSGCSVPVLFAEALAKGVGDFDTRKALTFMIKDADGSTPDPTMMGRFSADYNTVGYVSTAVERGCVSRHIEYSYYDWCIGAFAAATGYPTVARVFKERSRRLWNLWNAETRGFHPRDPDGAWTRAYDPHMRRGDSWNDPYYYETSGKGWSFSAFQDFHELIRRMGGATAFISALDAYFHDAEHGFHLKETQMHIPWLYTYAGRPDLSAQRVGRLLDTCFTDSRDGLRDNEDMGCQSAFYMWSSMGLYPVMGQDIYLLAPPRFDRVTIHPMGSDAALTITRDPGRDGPFIRGVILNGREIDRAWIRHREISGGGTIEFRLSDARTAWGTRDLPPAPV